MLPKTEVSKHPLFSLENLYQAYRKCRRHKRNTHNAMIFEQNLEENLFTEVTENCRFRKVRRQDFECLPEHKTLFKASHGCGLPIGNLTSQFFANVYLDALDQFVKHKLKARLYLRYCDDLVLLSENKEEVAEWERRIEAFLSAHLSLRLNERRKLRSVSYGIDF